MLTKVGEVFYAFFSSSGNLTFHILVDRTRDNHFINILKKIFNIAFYEKIAHFSESHFENFQKFLNVL